MSKPTNPHAKAWASFVNETKEHALTVLHDDGLYRHLRVQAPGTRMWSWDVTTWPGHLATSGDIADGQMFTRLPDMIQFFTLPDSLRDYYSDGAPCIDVRYWAEKLCGGRSHEAKVYDSQTFLSRVQETLEEDEKLGLEAQALRARQVELLERIRNCRHRAVTEDTSPTVQERLEAHWRGEIDQDALFDQAGLTQQEMDTLHEEFDILELECTPILQKSPAQRRDEVLEDARWHSSSEHEAHTWLAENEEFVGTDTWEWDLREYDLHFLFTCYAIDRTVMLYREHLAARPAVAVTTPSAEEQHVSTHP